MIICFAEGHISSTMHDKNSIFASLLNIDFDCQLLKVERFFPSPSLQNSGRKKTFSHHVVKRVKCIFDRDFRLGQVILCYNR